MKIRMGAGALSIETLTAWCGGRCVTAGFEGAVSYVCTDSREADGDTLLCAICGERVDGHDYMASAHGMGGRVFLCQRIPEDLPTPYAAIVVEDTVEAMGQLAAAYRAAYLSSLRPVAITGSVGKTTTKECVAAVLSAGGAVFKKDGNFNSTIGLPLTVIEMPPVTEAGYVPVLEMGMSGLGEIHAMTTAVRPHIGLITNIGSSHLELLGTRDNIACAKWEMTHGMGEGDLLLINGDEPLLTARMAEAEAQGIRVLRVSVTEPTAPVYACVTGARDGGMTFDLTLRVEGAVSPTVWRDLYIPAMGEHMVWAAAFAAAVGHLHGMTRETVQSGLTQYRSAAMRQSRRQVGGVTFLEDCYNAAPESMRAALGVLKYAPNRKIAVLGDMRELGENEIALHRGVGQAVAAMGADLLLTVGTLGAHIGAGALEAGMPAEQVWVAAPHETYEAVALRLAAVLKGGDTVLFKASRAMKLETLAAALEAAMTH